MMHARRLLQFGRYCVVGVLNTLVTFGVIYICKSLLGWNLYVCNVLGYVAGLVNSFLLNKSWTFRSHGRLHREAVRFLAGFGLCYLLQLWVVWMLTSSPFGAFDYRVCGIVLSGYGIATIIGNVVYTLSNYVFNKLVTFR